MILKILLLFSFIQSGLASETCRNDYDEAMNGLDHINHLANISTSLEDYSKNVAKTLDSIINKYDNQFVAEKEKWLFDEVNTVQRTGQVNHGLYQARKGKYKYFLKNIGPLDSDSQQRIAIQYYYKAQLLNALELGPQTAIVKFKNHYYMIMDEIPGINIKELIYETGENQITLEMISRILGKEFKNTNDARKAYAKAILNDSSLINKMKNAAKKLEQHALSDVNDFQFMLHPATKEGPSFFSIIDSEGFQVYPKDIDISQLEHLNPSHQMVEILSKLRKMAY